MSRVALSAHDGGDRLAPVWIGLLLMLAVLPVPFGSNRPLAWSVMALCTSLLLAGWTVSLGCGYRRLVWRPALAVPLLCAVAVIGWVLLSTVPSAGFAHPVWAMTSEAFGRAVTDRMALSAEAALVGLMRLLAYMSIFWLSLQYCRDRGRADMMLKWVSWCGLLLAAYGLINYFAGNAYSLWYARWIGQADVTSTFVNRNHYATYAGLGLLCAAALGIAAFRSAWQVSDRSQRPFPRTLECLIGRPLVYFVITLIIAMAWLQSHSRMGVAAVLVGVVVMIALMMGVKIIRRQRFAWAVAVLMLLFLFQVSGGVTLERLGATTGEAERGPLYSIVIDQILDAPYAGSGYGSFAQSFLIYRDLRLPGTTMFYQAHNSYLELAAELGVPMTLLLLLAIGWCAGLCLSGAFRRARSQIYPIVAVAATVVVGVHALVDFSAQIPAVAALYAALLGMGVAQSWSTNDASGRAPEARRAL
ncbi:O-antigen ligase family protein [Rhizorhabdus dicambivorans]|uniref:O-antigen ligase domain-containing protein n=1 Tax=Rhizorhabdus dicambivorans TaxID=1850238 RepID=A0A2A4FNS9_9SPHN|nr:O-antigen ligase family protein [Rhizorhabdus dicambivorans]ATE66189.1 O-antigen ligase domain-containing protein [Rhizorhabdus dicambivorans]PCE39749.1 O-antigen ligase domain-containing protein [Rhizorhabdus dicambivorans]